MEDPWWYHLILISLLPNEKRRNSKEVSASATVHSLLIAHPLYFQTYRIPMTQSCHIVKLDGTSPRWYKKVELEQLKSGSFLLLVDGRKVINKLEVAVEAPSEQLAWCVASEWEAQRNRVKIPTLPLVWHAGTIPLKTITPIISTTITINISIIITSIVTVTIVITSITIANYFSEQTQLAFASLSSIQQRNQLLDDLGYLFRTDLAWYYWCDDRGIVMVMTVMWWEWGSEWWWYAGDDDNPLMVLSSASDLWTTLTLPENKMQCTNPFAIGSLPITKFRSSPSTKWKFPILEIWRPKLCLIFSSSTAGVWSVSNLYAPI